MHVLLILHLVAAALFTICSAAPLVITPTIHDLDCPPSCLTLGGQPCIPCHPSSIDKPRGKAYYPPHRIDENLICGPGAGQIPCLKVRPRSVAIASNEHAKAEALADASRGPGVMEGDTVALRDADVGGKRGAVEDFVSGSGLVVDGRADDTAALQEADAVGKRGAAAAAAARLSHSLPSPDVRESDTAAGVEAPAAVGRKGALGPRGDYYCPEHCLHPVAPECSACVIRDRPSSDGKDGDDKDGKGQDDGDEHEGTRAAVGA
ncbi:hypothetical protein B0A50_04643 [Salinomyces thailandicus]|uniref:Uncharacterized protein n=1 Tax=Salinomyces thailandicus TaxID=706561 RepID=A0A4U0TVV9_9PEZI|nr:hypothetical protein B0A50_04643 [Salinomyces thailandica]